MLFAGNINVILCRFVHPNLEYFYNLLVVQLQFVGIESVHLSVFLPREEVGGGHTSQPDLCFPTLAL